MHSGSKRDEAFRMWMEPSAGGGHRSYEEIAAALGISKQTIVRWAKQDKWISRRNRIQEKAVEKLDEDLAIKKARLASRIKKLRNHIMDQLHGMEASSLEGGSHAVVSLIKTEMQLIEPKKVPADSIEFAKRLVPRVVIAVLDMLSDDEVVRQKIEVKKNELLKLASEDAVKFANEEFKAK